MLALQGWRDSLCPCGCGFPAVVAQDPMTEFRVNVPDPVRCQVRAVMSQRQRDHESPTPPEALLWRAEVRSDPGADADGEEH